VKRGEFQSRRFDRLFEDNTPEESSGNAHRALKGEWQKGTGGRNNLAFA